MRGFACIVLVIVLLMFVALVFVAALTATPACPNSTSPPGCASYLGIGSLLIAVLVGGAAGGFTNSLTGGQEFGMRHPNTRGHKPRREAAAAETLSAIPGKTHSREPDSVFDPGYLGDTFIGLMAGCVGIAFVTHNLKASPWDYTSVALVDTWFLDFALSYVCGFLGLKLIKSVAENVFAGDKVREAKKTAALAQERLDAVEKDVDDTKGAALFLNGIVALQQKDYDTAELMFNESMKVEGWRTTRALISLARVERRRHNLVKAIALLDEAISQESKEKKPSRVAVAFWNRACYRTLQRLAQPSPENAIGRILADLRESIKIEPSFSSELGDPDFNTIRDDPAFHDFTQEAAGSMAPASCTNTPQAPTGQETTDSTQLNERPGTEPPPTDTPGATNSDEPNPSGDTNR